jgi:hypothetical protein
VALGQRSEFIVLGRASDRSDDFEEVAFAGGAVVEVS